MGVDGLQRRTRLQLLVIMTHQDSYYLKNTGKGFTLIEIMVVIAIMGLLAAIITASLSSAKAKARDSRRTSDLKEIQGALEVYYSLNQQYPVCAFPTNDVPGYIISMTCLQTALSSILPTLPRPPQYPNESYTYDNWCRSPAVSDSAHYRMWIGSETNLNGLQNNWWGDYTVGVTNCEDPS